MVMGYLYDRILDRVIDPLLKPTVRAALVLRKITPTLLDAVLPDVLPDGLKAGEVFDRLMQEFALVDSSSVFAGVLLLSLPKKHCGYARMYVMQRYDF